MSTVTVLGSVNMDLVVRVPSLPHPGDTVLGDRLLTIGGGKGANQAAAAARLGARVRMVARFGDDAFGQQLLEELEGDDVDVLFTFDAGTPSGAALILVDDRGQNIVAVAPAAGAAAATKVGARDSLPHSDDLRRMFGIDVATLRARRRR